MVIYRIDPFLMLFSSFKFFFFIIFRDSFEREINTRYKKTLKGEHTAAAAKRWGKSCAAAAEMKCDRSGCCCCLVSRCCAPGAYYMRLFKPIFFSFSLFLYFDYSLRVIYSLGFLLVSPNTFVCILCDVILLACCTPHSTQASSTGAAALACAFYQ